MADAETLTQVAVELNQMHEYARQELVAYVAWFTFFITALLAAMSWSLKASLDENGRVVAPQPFYCMVILFTTQLIFSILATRGIAADFLRTDARGLELLKLLPSPSSSHSAQSPFPQGIHFAIRLMAWTLWTNLILWLAVAFYVKRKRRKKVAGSPA